MTKDQVIKLQKQLVASGYMTQAEMDTGPGIYGPRTTAAMNKAVTASMSTHPTLAPMVAQNSPETLAYASSTGDYSGLKTVTGQPFSTFDQQEAENTAKAALEPYYTALQEKDRADTEAAIKQQQLKYQKDLADSKVNFESDKTNLDQTAANQGVLFSGGRAQKEQALQNKYESYQQYNKETTGASIGNLARDFQYKYGNNAASGLSSLYNLGGNTYNAGVSQGGVGSSGLSSVYNPSAYNFQGTTNTAKQSEIQKRAAALLGNKANKLMASGYKNQF